MTYEELVEKIDDEGEFQVQYFDCKPIFISALRAVVELHKPFNADTDKPSCSRCMDATMENGKYEMMMSPYPCETIRTIEKKLV